MWDCVGWQWLIPVCVLTALSAACSSSVETGSDSVSDSVSTTVTVTNTVTIPPSTTTTTEPPTTTSATSSTTTTTIGFDPVAAIDAVMGAGEWWITGHEVTLDQVEAYAAVNVQVTEEGDSVWVEVLGTDEGNVHALYSALAICAWVEGGETPMSIVDNIAGASIRFTADTDEVGLFIGLALSGAADVFCPELSDDIRNIVP